MVWTPIWTYHPLLLWGTEGLRRQQLSLMELEGQAPCLLGLVHPPTMAPTPVPSRVPILNRPQKHGVSSLPTLRSTQAPRLQVEPTASVLVLNIMDKCR